MHSVYTTAAPRATPSSDPESPASQGGLADSDESLPLLGINRGRVLRWGHSERWHTVSTFFDKNAGLSLIAASRFFHSAMNVCVKWVNSLEEPVPVLEVSVAWLKVMF